MSTYINYHTVPDLALSYVQGQGLLAQECDEAESHAEPDCHWPMHARDIKQAQLRLAAWVHDGIWRSYWVIQCFAENAPAHFYSHNAP